MDGVVMALTLIAAYDVSDDGRRARLAATLQQHGDRLQYSLFLCTLDDDAELNDLRREVADIIDRDEDSFLLLRQCAACWHDMEASGQAHPHRPDLYWAAL